MSIARTILRWWTATLGAWLVWAAVAVAGEAAGDLDRAMLEAAFPPPYSVGEKQADLPVWPVIENTGGAGRLAAYVFQTRDLAPIPGFSGTPPNLLVMLAPDGTFRGVRVLSQHEPVFVEGLGPEPLDRFVEQYLGKSLGRNIKVVPPGKAEATNAAGSASVAIDGVSKATASVRIINESILASALIVARARLGHAATAAQQAPPRAVRTDITETHDPASLKASGLVTLARITNRMVEAAFAGSDGAGLDDEAIRNADGLFAEVGVSLLDVPTAARSLLGPAGAGYLERMREAGVVSLFVQVSGRFEPFGDGFVPGAVPDRLGLSQSDLMIDMRDFAYDRPLAIAPLGDAPFAVFRVFAKAGLDPSRPFNLVLRVTRSKGQLFPERFSRDVMVPVSVPERYFTAPVAHEAEATGVLAIWQDRSTDLAVVLAALLGLGTVLTLQQRTTVSARAFGVFRWAFLAFTLIVLGWIYQAQLSIVTLIGLVKAIETRDLAFLLWDPVSLVIWAAAILGAIAWGRGFFCGWLCPFGALQEFVASLAKALRIRQWTVPPAWDQRLRAVKYAMLALTLVVAFAAPTRAEIVAEVEPFKTAITLVFVRSWPLVVYAVGLLVLNLFIYKAFCRYLCPLGAAMAVFGRLRQFDWIARRVECGSPCQLCKVKCRYGAIDRAGAVHYDECFQCMDCVVIHNSPATCVPQVIATRRGVRGAGQPPVRVRPPRPQEVTP